MIKLTPTTEEELIKYRKSAEKAMEDLKKTTKPFNAIADTKWAKGRLMAINTYINELETLLYQEIK